MNLIASSSGCWNFWLVNRRVEQQKTATALKHYAKFVKINKENYY